ncbi:MAG TPA: hypothetical protein VGA27_12110, partial [Candidatus Binatia bacterium]
FGWVGNPVTSNHLLYMRTDAPYKSMDDIRNASAAPKCGSNGITSTGYYLPKLMEETLGTKFDIVLGYQSGQDVDLAVERGEVVCRAFTITAYFAREPVYFLAQARFRQRLDAEWSETRVTAQGRADHL